MNWLDAAIIVAVIWFTFAAFHAGILRETVTITAAVLGVILAGLFYRDLNDQVLGFIDNERIANVTAFGLLMGAVVLAGQILALILKPTVQMLQLGIFDQLAGAIFGFVKALVLVEIFLFTVITLGSDGWGFRRTVDESFISELIVDKAPVLLNILPDEFEAEVDDFSARV